MLHKALWLLLILGCLQPSWSAAQQDPFLYDDIEERTTYSEDLGNGLIQQDEAKTFTGGVAHLLDLAGESKKPASNEPVRSLVRTPPPLYQPSGNDYLDYHMREEARKPLPQRTPFGDNRLEELQRNLKNLGDDEKERRENEKLFIGRQRLR
jgi:hypothetical protein